jgi:hypothetical protein
MMARLGIAVLAVVVLVGLASVAMGAVGWAGNIWPCSGATYTSNDDISVYVQVWKEGCTDSSTAGPCADVEAYLYYGCKGSGTFTEVPMSYNVDTGNNDEFVGVIPSGHGCDTVEFYVKVVDITDQSEYYGQDQCSNNPNFFLPITQMTSQDVTVRFTMCLTSGVETSGGVCVVGSQAPIGDWSQGVAMSLSCPSQDPNLYQADVLFPAGSNPYVEYKYQKDDCVTWESTGNHSFTIDDTDSFFEIPYVDGWEYLTPDCPGCATATEDVGWGAIKALYR